MGQKEGGKFKILYESLKEKVLADLILEEVEEWDCVDYREALMIWIEEREGEHRGEEKEGGLEEGEHHEEIGGRGAGEQAGLGEEEKLGEGEVMVRGGSGKENLGSGGDEGGNKGREGQERGGKEGPGQQGDGQGVCGTGEGLSGRGPANQRQEQHQLKDSKEQAQQQQQQQRETIEHGKIERRAALKELAQKVQQQQPSRLRVHMNS